MRVNFIITCHSHVDQIPAAIEVLASYVIVQPRWVVCYNGDDPRVPCDRRIRNRGLHRGDRDLTVCGYRMLRRAEPCFRYVKLSVDSWLMDEQVIVRLFEEMEARQVPYAGNHWDRDDSLATDIIFADLRFGNVLRYLSRRLFLRGHYERLLFKAVRRQNRGWYEIPERQPVHPDYRYACAALGWTMQHTLAQNLDAWRRFGERGRQPTDSEGAP